MMRSPGGKHPLPPDLIKSRPPSLTKMYMHTWASQKVQGGPSEIFIAMGGFLGGGGSPFWDFSGGAALPGPPCAHVWSEDLEAY